MHLKICENDGTDELILNLEMTLVIHRYNTY